MTSDNPDPSSKSALKNIFGYFKKGPRSEKENQFNEEIYRNLDTHRKDMVHGIVRLSELNAKDIMIPRVDLVAVESNIDLKNLVKIVMDAGHSRLPVYEDTVDNIAGLLYVKDLIKLLADKSRKFNLKRLVHAPFFVPETMPLDELLYEFKTKKLHLAIVVDEYGGVGGIVTMEDILEEIVGEINDEFDTEELPEFEKKGSKTYEVDSRMLIADFNDELEQEIPTDDFDTIGGFVFDLFGRIPEKDETIKYEDLTFKIIDIEGTKIIRISVSFSKQK